MWKLLRSLFGFIQGRQRLPPYERLLWIGPGAGWDQTGRRIEVDGWRGSVVGGSGLTILVHWEDEK